MYFFRLIRPINLLIIALTMLGVRTYLYWFSEVRPNSELNFWLLVLSTILIAAAGNIINDYFDTRADRVNRPKTVIVGKHIKPRWAILSHWSLNAIAFSVGLYLGWYYQSFLFMVIHVIAMTILWWYSVSLKKKPMIGNLVVSMLTVLVIFLTYRFLILEGYPNDENLTTNDTVFNIPPYVVILIFMGMAFVHNFAREIVKDAEDVTGDLVIGARTIPMILGNRVTLRIIGTVVALFPIIYVIGIFSFSNFDWIRSLPITLAAITNIVVLLVTFFANEKTAIVLVKNLLKIAMFFGIIYLFLPQ